MKWVTDIETHDLSTPVTQIGNNAVYDISSPDDIRLAFYRLSKLRDQRVYSWFNKLMLDKKRNPIALLSRTVVNRALRGVHEIISLMLTPEIYDELRDLISTRNLVEGVYIVSRTTFEECVGLSANSVQACACLIDLQQATSVLPEPTKIEDCSNVKVPQREAPAPSKLSATQYLWQDSCVFGLDRRERAGIIRPPILILDDVRSSDNIGVIMRTAFSLGVVSLLVTRASFAAIGCRAGRTSMGALTFFSIYVADELIQTLDELQQMGIEVIGTSPRGAENIHSRSHRKWALIMGNEELGSSAEVMAKCDTCHKIPQAAGDSLSVSVATGICIYELTREFNSGLQIGAGDC